jgi:hypothetical protein
MFDFEEIQDLTTKYFCSKTEKKFNDFWPYLKTGLWKKIIPENYDFNNLLSESNQYDCKPLFENFYLLQAGMGFNSVSNKIEQKVYFPKLTYISWEQFIELTAKFFQQFANKRIGVQLSGGLDSSIIIGLLSLLKIQFWTVELRSNRYEFRTERRVQDLIRPLASGSKIINFEDVLPFSNLLEIPLHEYPDTTSLNYASENALANACQEMGIEILLTGNGGDDLFSEKLNENPCNCNWNPYNFDPGWIREFIYSPKEIKLLSFYSIPFVLNYIFTHRRGLREDEQKSWAREHFARILPSELHRFNYCADFWGLYVSGLQNSKNTIEYLYEITNKIVQNNKFTPTQFKHLFSKDISLTDKKLYQIIESRVSLAVWIYNLNKI